MAESVMMGSMHNKETDQLNMPIRKVSDYKLVAHIASGSYADVGHFTDTLNKNKHVAIKILRHDCLHEPHATQLDRELSVLKIANHDCLVTFITSFRQGNKGLYHIVMELCPYTLAELIKIREVPLEDAKVIIASLLDGLSFLHDINVMHRNLKPEDILITTLGRIKIADFGSARKFERNRGRHRHYTGYVSTMLYSAPELFLGALDYGPEIDMWSLGCIIPSLFTMLPLFPGQSFMQQLGFISNICGSITPDTLSGVEELHWYPTFTLQAGIKRNLKQYLREAFISDEDVIDLIDKLLILDPSRRYSAKQGYFHEVTNGLHAYRPPLRYKEVMKKLREHHRFLTSL